MAHSDTAALSVLIVDDDPDFRELLKLALEKLGVGKVAAAGSAKAGLELIEAGSTDVQLILLDLDMPDVSGVAFLHSIRSSQDPKIAKLPIVIVSAFDSERVKEGVEPFGVLGFLGKPPNMTELQRLLESAAAG